MKKSISSVLVLVLAMAVIASGTLAKGKAEIPGEASCNSVSFEITDTTTSQNTIEVTLKNSRRPIHQFEVLIEGTKGEEAVIVNEMLGDGEEKTISVNYDSSLNLNRDYIIEENSSLVLGLDFSEGVNNDAFDKSGSGNHGVLGGSCVTDLCKPTWTANGRFGNALNFDGNLNYVNISDAASLRGMKELSFEAWIKGNNQTQWAKLLYKKNAYFLDIKDGKYPRVLIKNMSGKEVSVTSNIAFKFDEWNHIAAVYDGSTNSPVKLYLNGELVGTSGPTMSGKVNDNDFYSLVIGSTINPTYPFKGTIDSVGIYNRALSEEEIVAHSKGEVINRGIGLAKSVKVTPVIKTGKNLISCKDKAVTAELEWWEARVTDSEMTPGDGFMWRVLDANSFNPHGQTFVPSKDSLSGIALDLLRIGNPGDIEVRVGTSFGDDSIFNGFVPAEVVSEGSYDTKKDCDFVELTFNDREVVPGQTYYIWLKPTSGTYNVRLGDWYSMCITQGAGDLYPNGVRCDSGRCSYPYSTTDLVFRTFYNGGIDQGSV